jgi:hypothetical protein
MHDDSLSLDLNAPSLREIVLHLLKYRLIDDPISLVQLVLNLISHHLDPAAD